MNDDYAFVIKILDILDHELERLHSLVRSVDDYGEFYFEIKDRLFSYQDILYSILVEYCLKSAEIIQNNAKRDKK